MAEKKVLLLNQSYEPLMGITLKRAMKHIINGKVDVVHTENKSISSARNSMAIPTVIRLNGKNYNKIHRFEPKYSKSGIHHRDNFTCAYCNKKTRINELTIDHIIPKSKGGLTTWTNCITACRRCNSYKSDFSIEETKMYLQFKPYIPKKLLMKLPPTNQNLLLINNWEYREHPDWVLYLKK